MILNVDVLVCVFSTAIGIRCKDGVVFGVEKLVLSKLYEEGSNKRIFNIDRHVGMVTTRTSPSQPPVTVVLCSLDGLCIQHHLC